MLAPMFFVLISFCNVSSSWSIRKELNNEKLQCFNTSIFNTNKKIEASIPQSPDKYEEKVQGSNETPVLALKPSGKTKPLKKKNETRQFYPQKMSKKRFSKHNQIRYEK